MTEEEQLAARFEDQRPYLHAIAFRVLGSHADADDAVQEAWLRLVRNGGGDIEDLRGWLTTVTGRICLDVLRRRGTRGEQPLELDIGALQREPAGGARLDPEEEAVLAESVGLALYVVMDALTPAERVSFVLHDVFEVPFDAIAAVLGRSTAASKMLASRARGRLRSGTPSPDSHAAAREVVEAFFAAAGRGDVAGLLSVLAPDVEVHAQGLEGEFVVRGAERLAARATTFARPDARVHPALVGGVPGVLITVDGRPTTVMAFTVAGGVVTAIRTVTDPARLEQVVPSWVA
ncbi:sigma-70 family RNA polymerase sigma factor [Actinomadura litoris]|uniref:sigma-70 family RNA polymerase sigma factor n=1 Tax=Actinomadura litoris TaxID=2678616 RepID=UPI001FA73195|nr:sigma-70 family RNA polymerase sigma factor [Actinomadura litoris]